MDQQRYARQISLPEIGEAGQARLLAASVLCVGAGGLGSPALLYLAAAGIGRLGIVDFDVVEASNLQRQVLFSTAQVGENKSTAARDRLLALNPDIVVEEFPERLHAGNAEDIIGQYDLVIDGTDNFSAKFLINDACVKFSKPLIYAAINQFEGQVSVFDGGNDHAPCYRCLYPHPPTQQVKNCAEAGVVGAVAGMMGVTQAAQAIMMLIPHNDFEPLVGTLWSIDTRNMRTNLFAIPKDRNCPTCSKPREDIVLPLDDLERLSIAEVRAADVKGGALADTVIFLDVREQDEWDLGHIEGAEHFALSRMVAGEMPDLCKNQNILLYCKAGMRSMQAATIMQQRGYGCLTNLSGGYDAWVS